jgi:hypothetical protein
MTTTDTEEWTGPTRYLPPPEPLGARTVWVVLSLA